MLPAVCGLHDRILTALSLIVESPAQILVTHMFQVMGSKKVGAALHPFTSAVVDGYGLAFVFHALYRVGLSAEVFGAPLLIQCAVA